MSQDSEKYLYFNVGLLKNSHALDALWQDALKHHMIDQLGQLIALRLTEYYEVMDKGILQLAASASITTAINSSRAGRGMTSASSVEISHAAPLTAEEEDHSDDEIPVAASPHAEQNAEEAADYWAVL